VRFAPQVTRPCAREPIPLADEPSPRAGTRIRPIEGERRRIGLRDWWLLVRPLSLGPLTWTAFFYVEDLDPMVDLARGRA
jgi:hypothetical protein